VKHRDRIFIGVAAMDDDRQAGFARGVYVDTKALLLDINDLLAVGNVLIDVVVVEARFRRCLSLWARSGFF
jgi:hypothetical protein